MNKMLEKLGMRTYIATLLVGEIATVLVGILRKMSIEEIAIMIAVYAGMVMISFIIVYAIIGKTEQKSGE